MVPGVETAEESLRFKKVSGERKHGVDFLLAQEDTSFQKCSDEIFFVLFFKSETDGLCDKSYNHTFY